MQADPLSQAFARRLAAPGIRLYRSEEWSSEVSGSRLQLRRALAEVTGAGEEVLDLEMRPRPKGFSVSISHHKKSGGFALASEDTRVGFDMELSHRVRPEIVARVCRLREELNQAPNPCALWTAKEAAYKALQGPSQPRGVADIEIGNWQPLEAGWYSCELIQTSVPRVGSFKGIVKVDELECLALFASKEIKCAG